MSPLGSHSIDAQTLARTGEAMFDLMCRLYPLCRSITGDGVRGTLDVLEQWIPLRRTEVPTSTPVFDWTVPREWSIEDAYIEHVASGQRFARFSDSNLHVVGYSAPVDTVLALDDLRPRLHTLPQHPEWIPFRSSYYKEDWGFCLADRVARELPQGDYRAVIRSRLFDGSLTLAEYFHRGESEQEVLVFAHTCHPSLCNDNLSGIVAAAAVAAHLIDRRTRYSYRIVFAPATIGSITWMAINEAHLSKVRHGLVLAMLGDAGPLRYQRTKNGKAPIDRACAAVLKHHGGAGVEVLDFSPWGFDERQFNTPGINLPVGRLTRALSGNYPQEHSSADAMDQISPQSLAQAWHAVLRVIDGLEADACWINLSPKGEPQLGRRGLYRQFGGHYDAVPERHMALLWLLHYSDGAHSMLDIAELCGLDPGLLAACAQDLERAGLLAKVANPT